MSTPLAHPWQQLFELPAPGGAVTGENYFLLRKHRHPWLLLPADSALARRALTLYPAQTAKARLARALLSLSLRCGRFPLAESLTLPRNRATPWEAFLQTLSPGPLPPVASLAGNPAAEGQRLVFLVFNARGQPQWVVKFGATGRAATLIQQEQQILKALPVGLPGAPVLRGEFAHAGMQAFAMDFYPGTNPCATDPAAPGAILHDWIRRDLEMPLLALPAIERLIAICGRENWFGSWYQSVATTSVRPVIMQGDFAPWNLKVAPTTGAWTVLDWERGELHGVPGWDWFHFVVQPELLVKRQPPTVILLKLQHLLKSPAFQSYAAATKIVGHESALLCAYFAYVAYVIRPSEGRGEIEQILACLHSAR